MFGLDVVAIIDGATIVANQLKRACGIPWRRRKFNECFGVHPGEIGRALLRILIAIAAPGVEPEVDGILANIPNRGSANNDVAVYVALDAADAATVKVEFDGSAKDCATGRGIGSTGESGEVQHRQKERKSSVGSG